ncbi:hypothetical protein EVAR_84987_1 [Eumeta japonica]|uniref:Uncharacterized protein n=1 Tax=Eumeta variegata TaxID=151549 RepID=A0A4C1WB75_EUMVA|nr:hypothetical protein EVAR_84987_1 [Eumeta japonica]
MEIAISSPDAIMIVNHFPFTEIDDRIFCPLARHRFLAPIGAFESGLDLRVRAKASTRAHTTLYHSKVGVYHDASFININMDQALAVA